MHIIKGESNINKKGISDHRRRKKGKKAHDREYKSMSISLTPIETNKSSGEDGNRISGLYIPLNYTSFSPVPCQQYAHHAVPPPA
jgi:ribosomal protein S8E